LDDARYADFLAGADPDRRALATETIVRRIVPRPPARAREARREIDADIATLEAGAQRRRIEDVRPAHLRSTDRGGRGRFRPTDQGTDPIPSCDEARNEKPGVHAGRAQNGDGQRHGIGESGGVSPGADGAPRRSPRVRRQPTGSRPLREPTCGSARDTPGAERRRRLSPGPRRTPPPRRGGGRTRT